jgi:predicted GNAT family acetyltransferase
VTTIRDNPDNDRYEIHEDDQLAGFAAYEISDGTIAFTHTEVDRAFEGRGLARQLVTEALDDARRRDLAVRPHCSYVRKVIASDADQYLDLVPSGDRERFDLPGADDRADGAPSS